MTDTVGGTVARGITEETARWLLAVFSRVCGAGAVAPVAADLVEADASVAARLGQTLVDVELAVLALEARLTGAHVATVVVVADAV